MTPQEALNVRDRIVTYGKSSIRKILSLNGGVIDQNGEVAIQIFQKVQDAQVVVWSDSLWVIGGCVNARQLQGMTFDIRFAPLQSQLWVVDKATAERSKERNKGVPVVAYLCGTVVMPDTNQQHWTVHAISEKSGKYSFGWKDGEGNEAPGFGHLIHGAEVPVETLSMVTRSLFMQQQIVGTERVTLPESVIRAANKGSRPPVPEVSVIRLRRTEDRGYGSGHAPQHREWSCQWMVSAHWRRQYYPSTGEHRPKLIEPYVKGDPTKELRAPREMVYAVTR